MLTVRNTLVALICISPFILVWDGLIAQGIVAGIIAFALAITARTLRPGETEFLVSIIPTANSGCGSTSAVAAASGTAAWGACAPAPDLDERRESAWASGSRRR